MSPDQRFMRRALALAKRGKQTFPNPRVGCVIVNKGKIVGEGFHAVYGGPHAEAIALKKAGARANGATVFVTLEPCCAHPGKKTPPCANALLKAGVAEVVVAVQDTNPLVRGRGLALLRKGGVRTRAGVRAAEARAVNERFHRPGGPKVILKTALSLDGFAKTANGRSKWITSPAARRDGHRLRAQCDAILVGIGTVVKDNPSLTSHGEGRDPVRVVLDSRGRTPRRARVLDGKAPTWIFTASSRVFPNARTIKVGRKAGGLNLPQVLRELSRGGIRSVLVEGGPTVHAAFLAAGLVDEARIYLAPKLLAGAADPNTAPRVTSAKISKFGPDVLFSGLLKP